MLDNIAKAPLMTAGGVVTAVVMAAVNTGFINPNSFGAWMTALAALAIGAFGKV
jgi:hypothetical protein